jgi:hypothetical protein
MGLTEPPFCALSDEIPSIFSNSFNKSSGLFRRQYLPVSPVVNSFSGSSSLFAQEKKKFTNRKMSKASFGFFTRNISL